MARLIDSSVFIQLERQGSSNAALRDLSRAEESAVSCVTAAELLLGLERADSPMRQLRRAAFVESILADLELVPFDLPAARVYARVSAQMRSTGQMIGQRDLMIAATALAHGYSVLTHNPRDFERVPGLITQLAQG